MTVNVEYRDAEPKSVTVRTQRRGSQYTHHPEYTFGMDGSTAVLRSIDADGDSYPVQSNAGTRAAARDAAADLPFVQGVVMFDD